MYSFGSSLSICSIRLRGYEDELLWSHNPSSIYTSSLGNKAMFLNNVQEECL